MVKEAGSWSNVVAEVLKEAVGVGGPGRSHVWCGVRCSGGGCCIDGGGVTKDKAFPRTG